MPYCTVFNELPSDGNLSNCTVLRPSCLTSLRVRMEVESFDSSLCIVRSSCFLKARFAIPVKMLEQWRCGVPYRALRLSH